MRLDTNYREKSVKNTSTWRLNNTFINNKQVTEWNQKGNKKFLETNDNENMITQNLWHVVKVVTRGKFIAVQSYLKKQDKHRVDNLTLHLKQLEKKPKNKPKLVEGKKS